jgi:hypothetical protein
MNCPGSVALIKTLKWEEEAEPEYRAEGTQAHAALARCLTEHLDAWEVADDPEMMDAIQVFLDVARPLTTLGGVRRSYGIPYIEYPMAAPEFHPGFFGTVDFAVVGTDRLPNDNEDGHTDHVILDVIDFKYGAGVYVDVEWNPQALYYAYGMLLLHPEVEWVRCTIVQPRITWAGPVVRTFELSAEDLTAWAEGTLKPAMVRTQHDKGLQLGDWCIFCPAKLVCPLMVGLFGAVAHADPRQIVDLKDSDIDRDYPLLANAKQYIKALEGEAFRRLSAGATDFERIKLVRKKADRVWKPEAAALFPTRFGDEAYTERELRSPAQMEKISGFAQELVKEYAYIPDTGLTVALTSDKKAAVVVKSLGQMYPAT